MIVHYLSSSTLPSRAANSVHVMKICAAIGRLGHDVTLFGRKGDDHDDDLFEAYGLDQRFDIRLSDAPGIPVLGSWMRALQARRDSKKLRHPDVFWGRNVQSVLAVSRLGAPLVLESHAPPASWYHRRLEAAVLRSPTFSHLVVISEALAAEYRRLHPRLDRDRIVVAHDGADPIADDVLPITELKGREGVVRVGYTGHLYAGRGIDLIVGVAQNCPELDMHLVGGTDEDVARWREQVGRDSVTNVYFHGFRPNAEIPRYLRSFDVVLAPYADRVAVAGGTGDTSRWMSPLKLFEYMAAGRAIITSRLPVLTEIIQDGANGLMCNPGDVDEWTAALKQLASDPARRADLARNAQADLNSTFTWEQRARRVLAAIDVQPAPLSH